MQKTIAIIRGTAGETYLDFHKRVQLLTAGLRDTMPGRIHYTITLEKPPRIAVIPFSRKKIAVVSVHSDQFSPPRILTKATGYDGSYIAMEALPVAYKKNWADGVQTPGLGLLTLFRKKKGIGNDVFIDRWHNGHTPFTLKAHPVYHYNRNVIDKRLDENGCHYDGIVEEHCLSRSELLNPLKFFAKSGTVIGNMIHTYFDTKSFIDYKSMETYLVQEYHVVS